MARLFTRESTQDCERQARAGGKQSHWMGSTGPGKSDTDRISTFTTLPGTVHPQAAHERLNRAVHRMAPRPRKVCANVRVASGSTGRAGQLLPAPGTPLVGITRRAARQVDCLEELGRPACTAVRVLAGCHYSPSVRPARPIHSRQPCSTPSLSANTRWKSGVTGRPQLSHSRMEISTQCQAEKPSRICTSEPLSRPRTVKPSVS